ncbi:MAG: VCBS repeat-containing protein [Flavobacteriales bacterium]|nr:VCBS repeat-containing protein [Flavobacteriales bacterium]
MAKEGPITVDKMLELVPSTKIRNYLFRNNGDLTFDNVSEKWGFNDPVNSNGAAYADLDNDGDLDLAINNMEDVSQIREHGDAAGSGSLPTHQTGGVGSRFTDERQGRTHYRKRKQYLEFMPTRGYQSSVEHMLPLRPWQSGTSGTAFIWMDGKVNELTAVAADQRSRCGTRMRAVGRRNTCSNRYSPK